jgi:hypothetical protein
MADDRRALNLELFLADDERMWLCGQEGNMGNNLNGKFMEDLKFEIKARYGDVADTFEGS